MKIEKADIRPGMRVRVSQMLRFGVKEMRIQVEGVVERVGREKTGSWFAHGRDDKLWLDRVELRKADGELVTLNLDRGSEIEMVEEGSDAPT
jgi:hypothetical protein